jgi:hypothetical protein
MGSNSSGRVGHGGLVPCGRAMRLNILTIRWLRERKNLIQNSPKRRYFETLIVGLIFGQLVALELLDFARMIREVPKSRAFGTGASKNVGFVRQVNRYVPKVAHGCIDNTHMQASLR